jgi:hypothetical protein
MLLSRFLKEPRLPPSSNIINKRKSFGPSVGRKVNGSNRLNQTAITDSNYSSTGQSQGTKIIKKKNFKRPEISYRN